jgi:hypothetical protein
VHRRPVTLRDRRTLPSPKFEVAGASGGWLTLSQPKNYYAPCGSLGMCANLTALADDAMALGRAKGIDFTVYDNINFVLSNDLDCRTWGGSHFSSVDNKSYGATWSPPPSQNALTYAHELGHSLALCTRDICTTRATARGM